MKMEFRIAITISLLIPCSVVSGDEVSNSTAKNTTVTCPRENEVDNIYIEDILGDWKAVELYMHLTNTGVVKYNSCPQIKIWETQEAARPTFGPSTEHQVHHVQYLNAQFRHDNRHLRILWDEAGQAAEYSLYFRNDSAGYWQAYNGQNGTLARLPNYQQFSGSVQVLKAVNDHLVLHFCQEANPHSPAQLYSVLFSRDPGTMPQWEVETIHSLLQNRKLSIASRRMVCGNSAADKLFRNTIISVIMSVLAYAIGSS